MMCRHCQEDRYLFARDLCRRCFDQPDIRALYPVAPHGRRGVGRHNAPTPPAEPTDAAPGSAAKLQVLAARAAAGQALFHPRDECLEAPCPVVIEPVRVSVERDAA